MYKKVRETDPENETQEAFRVFDAEGKGFIGEYEICQHLQLTG